MSVFTTALVIINSFLIASTMLLLNLSKADNDFESSNQSRSENSMLNFNKLKESISNVNWNEYFDKVSRNDSTRVASPGPPGNASNNSYLDPNGPQVQFILFTRNNPHYNLKLNDHDNFVKSPYNFSCLTKIIIHGFLSSTREDIFVLNRDAYMDTGYFNVIGMDWSVLCEFEYFTAMRGAQIAGNTLGAFINYLIKEDVDYGNIHLIGHSLGAHVAAMGAAKVKGGKVHRISGLDPAGPGYNNDVPLNYRLDPSDAQLVDVIHTNMRVLSLSYPQGHLDFYPNGGKLQPGCPYMYDIWTIGESMECNHGRAYHYFAESIRNKGAFKSYRCFNVESANAENCLTETNVYMGQEETYEILDCNRSKAKMVYTFRPSDWQYALRKCDSMNVSWYGLYYLKTKNQSSFSLS